MKQINETKHKIINCSSKDTCKFIKDKTVGLVVTSPPYPMIEMWDDCFIAQSADAKNALNEGRFEDAFEAMHKVLDKTWEDVDRVIIDGGIVCINIGDATKNCDGQFKLFSNHTRIINKFLSMGYDVLPDIHWHKPTNAPNKFMGSGMYPPCAYVTYEHEYILVFRKGGNRKFVNAEKNIRHNSAYFWEERNIWFSDLWEIKGTTQKLKKGASRTRSAAFPFELAYRLVNMYSMKYDLIYDPFSGTGTVAKAAIASERNSISVDIDEKLCEQTFDSIFDSIDEINRYIMKRIEKHERTIDVLSKKEKEKLYDAIYHPFKVKTRQEREILFALVSTIISTNHGILCTYTKIKKI